MSRKNETQAKGSQKSYQVTIGNGNSNVAIGDDNNQQINSSITKIREADIEKIKPMFDELRQQVSQQAPPDKKAAALKQVDELQQQVTSNKPDPAAFVNAKSWFVKNLPTVLGSVTALLVNPLVGKVVEAAGTMAADAIKQQFGGK